MKIDVKFKDIIAEFITYPIMKILIKIMNLIVRKK